MALSSITPIGIGEASRQGPGIALGPLLPEDLGAVFSWLNDANTAKLDMPYQPVNCLAYKEWLDKLARDTSQLLFAIRHATAPGPCIGFVMFKNFQLLYHSAELGTRIGRDSDRGKGYGARAVRLALDYAWNTLNLHRVSLTVFADNARAIACYRRAGFGEEGLMREAAFIDGRWIDVVLMAALRPR